MDVDIETRFETVKALIPFSDWKKEDLIHRNPSSSNCSDDAKVWIQNRQLILAELCYLNDVVVDGLLAEWKNNQVRAQRRMSPNDPSTSPSGLEQIEKFCSALSKLSFESWTSVNEIHEWILLLREIDISSYECLNGLVEDLQERTVRLLHNLVHRTFVFVEQPSHTISTNSSYFSFAIKWLAGSAFNDPIKKSSFKISIFSETSMEDVQMSDAIGTILFESRAKKNNTETGSTFEFSKVKLTNFRRSVAAKTKNIALDKFKIRIATEEFKIGIPSLTCKVSEYSLPFAVVSNSSQDEKVWPLIIWNNAVMKCRGVASQPNDINENVPWKFLAKELSELFEIKVMTSKEEKGPPLTQEARNFLASKVFREPSYQNSDEMLITYRQFAVDGHFIADDPEKLVQFSLWQWIHRIILLLSGSLNEEWSKRHIIGFISRSQSEKRLNQEFVLEGTFLIRFSEKNFGAISIAHVYKDTKRVRRVDSIMPSTSEQLKAKSLACQILEPKALLYLYPNIPKETVFKIDMKPLNGDGYKPPESLNEQFRTMLTGKRSLQSTPSTSTSNEPGPSSLPNNNEVQNHVQMLLSDDDGDWCFLTPDSDQP